MIKDRVGRIYQIVCLLFSSVSSSTAEGDKSLFGQHQRGLPAPVLCFNCLVWCSVSLFPSVVFQHNLVALANNTGLVGIIHSVTSNAWTVLVARAFHLTRKENFSNSAPHLVPRSIHNPHPSYPSRQWSNWLQNSMLSPAFSGHSWNNFCLFKFCMKLTIRLD